jgi:hypothetical protein
VSGSVFTPGVVVAIVSNSGWGVPRPRKSKIEKTYKNGNFTLEGSPQQWRPFTGWASKTGGSAYSGEKCEIWAEKHDEMLVLAALHSRWNAAHDVIVKARSKDITLKIVEAAEMLVKTLADNEARP